MKLLFYDKFWESMLELPKGAQKKVLEFNKKFRENPKSSAIHLEPISSFKDQSLRSARVDQSYRAIIKVPDEGNAYYLMWVDNHDEAYRWAENKIFQWNENTESMQVFTAPEEVPVQLDDEKTGENKGLFSIYSQKQLLQIGVPEILLPSIRKITDINDLEKIEKYLPSDVFENLFYLSDGADIAHLIREVQGGKTDGSNIDEQVNSINNQRNFIELTDDSLFNEVLSGSLNKWKYYLHPSQRKLVAGNFNGSVKISGGAGTGKTVAAMHRLKHLSANRKPGEKILFTTFTRALTDNLKTLIKGLDVDLENICIQNIDAFAYEQAKELGIFEEGFKVFEFNNIKQPDDIWEDIISHSLIPFDIDFLMKEFQEVVLYNNIKDMKSYLNVSRIGREKPVSRRQKAALWELFTEYRNIRIDDGYYHREEVFNQLSEHFSSVNDKPFDYILVDELQDFSNVELRYIRSMVAPKPNDLFMVGDPLQTIYNRKINFSSVDINIRGRRSQRLRINYRTTEEIRKYATNIIKDDEFDDFDGGNEDKNGYRSLFHGALPVYNVYKTKREEVDAVLDQIKTLSNAGYKLSDIALACRLKNSIKDFQTSLHQNEVPYYRFENGSWHGNKDGVRLLTLHALKGLEFRHVILADVNERSCPKLSVDFEYMSKAEKEIHLRNEKALMYVAISRAIESVYISGVGKNSEILVK